LPGTAIGVVLIIVFWAAVDIRSSEPGPSYGSPGAG